ncbi:hypothetical protein ACKQTC_05135 [Peptococcus simiae]|uniref:PASTA domain-containing protein n=1 Tax=Peptococcus simiae TaxID=1643805 RepID=A0ABW9GYT3_9FIRM
MIDSLKVKNIVQKIDPNTAKKIVQSTITAAAIINSRLEKVSDLKRETEVKVPDLYKKGFPITIDDAEKRLKQCGLGICKIPLTVQEAKAKYRNCRMDEVISSNKKQGAQALIGETIDVRYVPEEVIRESQRIFEAAELKKQTDKERVIEAAKRGADKVLPKKKSSKTE